MNGKGIPFVGTSASTTLMFSSACATMPITIPIPSNMPNRSGARNAARMPRPPTDAPRPPPPRKTAGKEDDPNHQRCPEIRLLPTQPRHNAKHQETRQEGAPEGSFIANSALQKARQK